MKNPKNIIPILGITVATILIISCDSDRSNSVLKPEYEISSSSLGSSSTLTSSSSNLENLSSSSVIDGSSSGGSLSSNSETLSSSSTSTPSSSSVVALATDIVINEINSEGIAGNYCDYVELYNKSEAAFTFVEADWKIQDGKDTDSLYIPNGTIIPAKGFITFCSEPGIDFLPITNAITPRYVPEAGFGLSGSKGDWITLYHKGVLIDSVGWGATELQNTGARKPDGGTWSVGNTASPNATNGN